MDLETHNSLYTKTEYDTSSHHARRDCWNRYYWQPLRSFLMVRVAVRARRLEFYPSSKHPRRRNALRRDDNASGTTRPSSSPPPTKMSFHFYALHAICMLIGASKNSSSCSLSRARVRNPIVCRCCIPPHERSPVETEMGREIDKGCRHLSSVYFVWKPLSLYRNSAGNSTNPLCLSHV